MNKKIIFGLCILFVLLGSLGSYIYLDFSNGKVVDNNLEALRHGEIDEIWCGHLQNSIDMLKANWRNYIPKFVFDNEEFLDRHINLYNEYCGDNCE